MSASTFTGAPLKLSENKYFSLCNGSCSDCVHYSVFSIKWNLGLCMNCKVHERSTKHKDRRRKSALISSERHTRSKPDNKCNFRYNTPEELKERVSDLNAGRKTTSAKVKKMILKLSEYNEVMDEQDSPDLVNCLKAALRHQSCIVPLHSSKLQLLVVLMSAY